MGGKSTYLRTTALMSILAQSGSFVPAEKAKMASLTESSHELEQVMTSAGRSTFMMEMIEVAHILRRATSNSLVLLDESVGVHRPLMAFPLHGQSLKTSANGFKPEPCLRRIITIDWTRRGS